MRQTLAPVLDAQSPPQRGAIALDLSTTPKIALSYDPFESGEAERFNRPA
jgi:hypothetical protein